MAQVAFVMVDNSGEKSTVAFSLPVITGANYDDIAGNGVGDNVGDLRIAIGAASLMNFVNTVVQAVNYPDTPVLPTSPWAQREDGLRVFYADADGGKYHVTIPGPDKTLFAQTGTDVVDHTSNAAAILLKNAIEANAASPSGDPVFVTGMRLVGRSN